MIPRYLWFMLFLLMEVLGPPAPAAQTAPHLPLPFSPATRLLVVSPHPDDEILGAAGLIQRVLRAGGQVRVVYMSSGDGFPEGVAALWHLPYPDFQDYRDYGRLREVEATQALAVLGVQPQSAQFLGFPDSGVCPLWTTYSFDNGYNYLSPFTLQDRPPTPAAVPADITYNGADVTQALVAVLQQFQPTLVVTSHPYDQHPDHCATYRFVHQALATVPRSAFAQPPALLTFLVHYGGWPTEEVDNPRLPLHPPSQFPESAHTWLPLVLSPAELQAKRQALTQYQSQMLVMGQYLLSFVRSNELFAPAFQGTPEAFQRLPGCRQPVP